VFLCVVIISETDLILLCIYGLQQVRANCIILRCTSYIQIQLQMLFFHIVTILCDALVTSFNKLLLSKTVYVVHSPSTMQQIVPSFLHFHFRHMFQP
jgi:hypothetical protein